MDLDDASPRRADDPLNRLTGQDLDPLSVAELESRIAVLEGEIARTRSRMAHAAGQRATADALFRT